MALASEKHRRRRARAPRADHDRVVFVSAHVEARKLRTPRTRFIAWPCQIAGRVSGCSYDAQTRRCRKAYAVAAARDDTPSLVKMFSGGGPPCAR